MLNSAKARLDPLILRVIVDTLCTKITVLTPKIPDCTTAIEVLPQPEGQKTNASNAAWMFSNEITAPGAVDKCFVADLAKNLLDRISN